MTHSRLAFALVSCLFGTALLHEGRRAHVNAPTNRLGLTADASMRVSAMSTRALRQTRTPGVDTATSSQYIADNIQVFNVAAHSAAKSSLPRLASFGPCPAGVPLARGAPLPVDLVLKTRAADAGSAAMLFESIRLLWSDYLMLTVVLDSEAEAATVTARAPPRSRWLIEPLRHPQAAGYAGMMWSNLWADVYTEAPLLGILDSDSVLQLRADRASLLSPSGELLLRYLRCERFSSPTAAPAVAWRAFEASDGCLFRRGVVHLLKAPYAGNFMVQTPFVIPRSALAALRAHVERVHRRPFDDVMAEATALQGDRGFSQQSAVGNFLLHFGNASGEVARLDGRAEAGGVTGLRFVAWGREEMPPHVGRHLGWEGGGSRVKERGTRRKVKWAPGPGYTRAAAGIIRRGVCRSFADADPQRCRAERLPPGAATLSDELYWFEGVTAAPEAAPEGAGLYAASRARSCHGRDGAPP